MMRNYALGVTSRLSTYVAGSHRERLSDRGDLLAAKHACLSTQYPRYNSAHYRARVHSRAQKERVVLNGYLHVSVLKRVQADWYSDPVRSSNCLAVPGERGSS